MTGAETTAAALAVVDFDPKDDDTTGGKVKGTAHPFACLFPKMTADQFAVLKASINHSGLREPITIMRDGRVLDGLHRLGAFAEIGEVGRIEAIDTLQSMGLAKVFNGTDREALQFVLDRNAARRHLTSNQRKDVARRLLQMREHEAREGATRRRGGPKPTERNVQLSNREIARAAGSSVDTVNRLAREIDPPEPEPERRRSSPGEIAFTEFNKALTTSRSIWSNAAAVDLAEIDAKHRRLILEVLDTVEQEIADTIGRIRAKLGEKPDPTPPASDDGPEGDYLPEETPADAEITVADEPLAIPPQFKRKPSAKPPARKVNATAKADREAHKLAVECRKLNDKAKAKKARERRAAAKAKKKPANKALAELQDSLSAVLRP